MFSGEGISWLKGNRLRKLMEDETYRTLTLGRLHKTLNRRLGPDEHVDDVVSITKSDNLFGTKLTVPAFLN